MLKKFTNNAIIVVLCFAMLALDKFGMSSFLHYPKVACCHWKNFEIFGFTRIFSKKSENVTTKKNPLM